MNNLEMARGALRRGKEWLQGAQRAQQDQRWADVVYASQMAAEQSLKAVLILLGIDAPKRHDLSEILRPLIDNVQLSQRFRKNIPRLARISKELAAIRAAAGYGYEKALQPNYFKPKAPQAIEDASFAYEMCSQLIEELAPS